MPDDIDRNQIDSEGRGRSIHKGDVPDPIRRRYYLDEKGGPGLGFYVDARIETPAFRDHGPRLVSGRADPNAIRDMANVAQHRGWTVVVVHGEPDFRREAWLAAMALGIEARGYQPTERDRQELERRVAQAERQTERGTAGVGRQQDAATMKVVEAVVRTRVTDRPTQDRILQAARGRIAAWLERGAQMRPVDFTAASPRRERGQERQRGR
ncbi:MAG: hypothetical protein KA085_13215 [Phenylobacterium sp.]|uniref:LPD7 domain-containing protein n=1 Tax=Phenylobacterium sp. TaxID=1871053 RepID=UPI001B76AF10|nr:LPD7 domain-containing protein [Phenylobacterium sp.]MBP7817083.1 hypothetical protein [Phenylobacterium sp.]